MSFSSPAVDVMRGSRKFCQRGSNTDNVFLRECREDRNATKSGPSSARQQNAFRWRADDGPPLNSGFVHL